MSNGGWARALLVIFSGLAVAGPARAAAPPPNGGPLLISTPNQPLSFVVGSKAEIADVTPEGMNDGDLSLRVFPGEVRGHLGPEPLDLRLEPRRLAGTLGSEPVGLDVIRVGQMLDVAGRFGEQSVAMQIGRAGIAARLGPCDYHLKFSLGHYRGFVTCGGAATPVDLTVPVALVAHDDRELAAMLTALLAR